MSEESKTPETDEAQFGTGRVSVDFARRLERERDEARHELSNCKSHFAIYDGKELDESVHMAVLHALKERNQLRKVADELGGAVRALYDDASGVKDFHPQYGYLQSHSYNPNSEVDKDLQASLESYSQLPHVIARKERGA